MIIYIILFLLIFFIFTILNSLIAKNYYIYNFLVKYKEDRKHFYDENINAIGKEKPVFTMDMEEFQKESKEARDYLRKVNIENPKYNIYYMGQIRQMSLIDNLGYFHVDEKIEYSMEIYHKGQNIIDQAIHEYKEKTKMKYLPFYWFLKVKTIKTLEDSKPKKKEKTIGYIWIAVLSYILTQLTSLLVNLASSYIYDWIK